MNSSIRIIRMLLEIGNEWNRRQLNEWGKKVGIEHLSWHTARHTMATLALEKGAEIRTVCELLGHTNISTTMRYANATDALKVKAVELLPKF